VTTEIDAAVRPLHHDEIEGTVAWLRLATAVVLGTIGGVGMWAVVVALPAVQAEFGVARGEASLAYTLTMAGFALGGVLSGRLADRYGIVLGFYVLGGFALAGALLIAQARHWAFDKA